MDSTNLGHTYPTNLSNNDVSYNSPSKRLVNHVNHRYSPMQKSSPKLFPSNPSSPAANRSFTGPLLTSMNFNSNLSTYIDSKSPGLAERIVQYKNEASQQKPCVTHQPKYGSPGLFPIVHLLKKEIPVRTISPNHRVTVKLAPADSYSGPAYSRMDYCNSRENMIRRRIMSSDRNDDAIQTQNVLEALRNISRKRIHAEEPYGGSNRAAKRPCHDSATTSESSNEENVSGGVTPASSNLGGTQNPARSVYCVDPITASLTSSHPNLIPSYEERLKRIKRKNREKVVQQKPIIQCTAETQTDAFSKSATINSAEKETTQTSPSRSPQKRTIEQLNDVEEVVVNDTKATQDKVFDSMPLESIKKNKLAKFLSILSNNSEEIPLPAATAIDMTSKPTETSTEIVKSSPSTSLSQSSTSPKITSIISQENKPKHNKHVTFNLPEVSKPEEVSVSIANTTSPTIFTIPSTKVDETLKPSTLPVELPKPLVKVDDTLKIPVLPSKKPDENVKVLSPFTFGVEAKSAVKDDVAKNTPIFGTSNISKPAETNIQNVAVISSPVVSLAVNTPASSAPASIFGSGMPRPLTAFNSPTSFPTLPSSTTTTTTVANSSNSSFSPFGKITTTVSTVASSIPSFGMYTPALSSSSFVFGAPTTSTNAPMFGTSSSTSTLTTNTTTAPRISSTPTLFGVPMTTNAAPKIGGFKFDLQSVASTTASVVSPFSVTPVASTSAVAIVTSANKPTNLFSFSQTTASATSSSAFGVSANPSSSAFKFGQNTLVSSSSNKNDVIFSTGIGLNATESTKTALPQPTNAFEKTSQIFGQDKVGAFGQTNVPSIPNASVAAPTGLTFSTTSNVPATTAPTFSPFFNNATPTASVFGAPATTVASMFSAGPVTTASTFNFTSPSTSTFGAPQINSNNNNTTQPIVNTFGNPPQTSSVFGTVKNESTIDGAGAPPVFKFGSSGSTPQTGLTNNVFGSNNGNNTNNLFAFGDGAKNNIAVTTASSFLPVPSKPPQGDVFKFGSNTTNQPPVNNANVFSANTAKSTQGDLFQFGAQNSTAGNNTNNNSGLLQNPPAFNASGPFSFGGDKPAATENKFGMSPFSGKQPSTASSMFSNTNATSPFNAMPIASSNSSTPSLFTFGSTQAAPAPNSNPPPLFGSQQQPTNAVMPFNASSTTINPTNNNNNNGASGNMFSGAIPSANMFGSGGGFGASSPAVPAAFGSSPAPPQFHPMPPTGMFNIGSGSSTPKSRTTLKARRRMV